MNLLAIGCSYRTTPVEVRERLAFTDEQLGRALDQLVSQPGFEAVILSTCNRVEVYLAAGSAAELATVLPGLLQDGDLLLLMGAGDIGAAAQQIARDGLGDAA